MKKNDNLLIDGIELSPNDMDDCFLIVTDRNGNIIKKVTNLGSKKQEEINFSIKTRKLSK